MPLTKSQITNVALGLLGAQKVVDVDTDASVQSIAALLHWDLVRDELLRGKDWNFATKRKVLEIPWVENVTQVAIQDDWINFYSATAHGLVTGDVVYFEECDDIEELEGTYVVERDTANWFKIYGEDRDTALLNITTPRYYANAPRFDYDWAFPLPADYLKALDWNARPGGTSRADWEIINGYLLSNDLEEEAELRYTAQITDVSVWPASFIQTFAHALAAAMAPGLSVDQALGERMRIRAENMALLAAGPNNVETRPRAVLAQTDSHYLAARNGLRIP